jgi:hypothetical protein
MKRIKTYKQLFESVSIVKESESKNIFKEFGLNWFIIENELPSNHTYVFLHPIGGYRTMVFDFGFEFTELREEDKFRVEYYYRKVRELIERYNLYVLKEIKNDDSFYIEARLEGEENITDIIKKYSKIYHVTLEKYLDGILTNGLIPNISSPDMNYSWEYPKTHFTNNPFNEMEKDLLFDFVMKQKDRNDKPVLLEIDMKGLNINFYLDKDAWQSPENDVWNFWTDSKIEKERIKIR